VKVESNHPRLNSVKVTCHTSVSWIATLGWTASRCHPNWYPPPWPNGIWIMDLTFTCCLSNKLNNKVLPVL